MHLMSGWFSSEFVLIYLLYVAISLAGIVAGAGIMLGTLFGAYRSHLNTCDKAIQARHVSIAELEMKIKQIAAKGI